MIRISNEIIKQSIVDQLKWDSSFDLNNVFVNVRDGQVQLSGNVQNMAAKMAAERNAQQVQGVIAVDNMLEIKFPPGAAFPNNTELKTKVEDLLSWNNELKSDHIEVTCENHVVTLSGKVETYWEKDHASNVVGTLKGVLEVNNKLSVLPARTLEDEYIREEIDRAFKRTYLIDEDKIQVQVNKGVVKLTGKVSNFFVKMQARNMAIQTRGVKEVQDTLTLA
ncbi:MAG: BON domain-containing protein [Bacteroidales bacterium]